MRELMLSAHFRSWEVLIYEVEGLHCLHWAGIQEDGIWGGWFQPEVHYLLSVMAALSSRLLALHQVTRLSVSLL